MVSNETWFPKLVSGQPEMSRVLEESVKLLGKRTNKNSPCSVCAQILALLSVGPKVGWAGVGCVYLFIGARRPCSLLFPLKDKATLALDAGAIKVNDGTAIRPLNCAA